MALQPGAARLKPGAPSGDTPRMDRHPGQRVVELRIPRRAFGRRVPAALERLGYRLVPGARQRAGGAGEADVVVAGGRELRKLRPGRGGRPVILVDSRSQNAGTERPVAAFVRRPAGLVEIYGALQRVLESHPRAVPRVQTTLPARCIHDQHDWPGAIVSLSEGGCLLRAARQPVGVAPLRVWFPLPETGLLQVTARPLYRRGPHLGLAFDALPDARPQYGSRSFRL
jgi:hypothetical protein